MRTLTNASELAGAGCGEIGAVLDHPPHPASPGLGFASPRLRDPLPPLANDSRWRWVAISGGRGITGLFLTPTDRPDAPLRPPSAPPWCRRSGCCLSR